ncbi:44807_t:CDS:2 [Gigaspora margarita]|uniref:44807_t:CDS:1 n=1 Tax=Gigaspora margarita TaxID=4874 RepID=A0ABN7UR89_GIGMA|nr:44807_t:CDS:2 [Gigaspora margarita]
MSKSSLNIDEKERRFEEISEYVQNLQKIGITYHLTKEISVLKDEIKDLKQEKFEIFVVNIAELVENFMKFAANGI